MFDVVSVERKKFAHFRDTKRSLEQLKSSLVCTLFELSGAWGFTQYTSIFEFQNSLYTNSLLSFLILCVHHCEYEGNYIFQENSIT